MAFYNLRDNQPVDKDMEITNPFAELGIMFRPTFERVNNRKELTTALMAHQVNEQIQWHFTKPLPPIPTSESLSPKEICDVYLLRLALLFGCLDKLAVSDSLFKDVKAVLDGDDENPLKLVRETILVYSTTVRCYEKGVAHYAGRQFSKTPRGGEKPDDEGNQSEDEHEEARSKKRPAKKRNNMRSEGNISDKWNIDRRLG
ncbi:hypothetical protein AJ79_01967 [Helicocarpus griseus UAMH5409]|uniref:Uncharacterized protein n=1 Tax=Helicocarpus griseus UAMH5409 TaxID=1447875 RepID=A0A2B7Y4P6_9EURO|nr:hypothetical protein AJ79_01967 [Helicocarpus griseus UAMH5409]